MLKVTCFIVFISILCSLPFLFPSSVHAVKKPRCSDQKPGSAPQIISITTEGNTVTLTWSEAADPVTYYLLAFGPAKDQLIYGAPNIGPKGTTSYTVRELTPGQRYYFRIRGINNCKPGAFSHTRTIIVGKKPTEVTYKMPNLSLYKEVKGASTSSEKKPSVVSSTLNVAPFCLQCYGLPLLGMQAFLLLVFLYISHKVSFIKPFFSIIIPLLFFAIFRYYHNCSSNEFFCKYYVQVSIIIFVFLMIFHKFIFIHKKIESTKLQLINTL